LNYHNPDVLLEVLDVLLGYVQRGAQFLRLDAIAYLWKEIGTNCIHLPQTHAVVQLLHAVLTDVAPHVRLITETNVNHQDNLSYFGDGTNEAQLIYNFALPPLMLHAFLSADSSILSDWAAELQTPSNETAFFNFLASHDGIGLNPIQDILSPTQVNNLVNSTLAHGGKISYKHNTNGSQSPYEMNINYFDALSDPTIPEPVELQVKRFLAAQSIILSLRGLPGIYFHSLFGSRNWPEGITLHGQNRAINRQKLALAELENALQTPGSLRAQVFTGYRKLLQQRAASPSFHPQARQKILHLGRSIFAVLRTSLEGNNKMLCLHNVTADTQQVGTWTLPPYETLWLSNPELY
jgi:sucrose phosphorylase